MTSPILKVQTLKKAYRRKIILDDISFKIYPGDIVGIVGANGCGKSTLLRLLSGAEAPTAGSIEYSGKNALKNRRLFKKYAGYVPQENPLFENLNVLDNLKLWYCDNPDGLIPAMERFGLDKYAHSPVNRLSGGMKKRLSIACSIADAPPVLILDEPGASLDIVCKSDICRYLSDYSRNGGTVIITSHEEGELALCNRMLYIENSRLCEIQPVTGTGLMKLIAKEVFNA